MMPVLVPFLLPFAGLYWLGLRFDQWRRGLRARALGRPVISVGNLTVGGTGKTPLMIYLVQQLRTLGKTPAVLTRGYAGFGAAATGENDETRLLQKRCGDVAIGSGADRFASAQALLARAPVDVFLLDDGFQHWPLRRDVDLLCIDATNPWGGGWLLPAGRLREPRRALRRASAVVINRAELVSPLRLRALIAEIEAVALGIPVFVSQTDYELTDAASGLRTPLASLAGARVMALSAIGNPRAFEATLVGCGARVRPERFPDHYDYTAADIARVTARARAANERVIMTEKDWVKVEALSPERAGLYVLRINLGFSADQQHRLDGLLKPALA
jgi:tetraacyldisaccharide 4'-kinase